MIRYAGEFSGFRIAGTVGYENGSRRGDAAIVDPTARRSPAAGRTSRSGVAASRSCTCRPVCSSRATTTPSTYSESADGQATSAGSGERLLGPEHHQQEGLPTQWLVQGGIPKNWFGYGNTSVYGEYGKATTGVLTTVRWPHLHDWQRRVTCRWLQRCDRIRR